MRSFPRWLIAAFALSMLVLVGGGVLFYLAQEQSLRERSEANLQTIARLKVNQIAEWRADLLAEAAVLMEGPFLTQGVAQWIANPEPKGAEQILSRFRSLQKYYHCRDVRLVDARGQVRLSLSGEGGPVHEDAAQALTAAFRDHAPMLSDLHVGPGALPPHFCVVAPFFIGSGTAPVAAIVLQIEARQFLYPLVQSWPAASRTAETLLVRRDGDSVLFLNDLRHQPDTALKLRIPLSRTDVPAVMAVLGKEGVFQGRDYRGVEVWSVLKPIPHSPWFLVAKVDAAEALADWRFQSILIVALVLAVLICLTTALGVVWQRNAKAHYRTLFQAEAERRKTEERYHITLMSVGDGVISTDATGRVELMNRVAETLTGWHQDEACGKPLEEAFRIVNEETARQVENPVRRVMRDGLVVGLANHTVLVARDGTERPIADSGAPIRDESGAITGVVLVFRDQTQERAAQKALRSLSSRLEALLASVPDIIMQVDNDKVYTWANQAGSEFFGEDVIGKEAAFYFEGEQPTYDLVAPLFQGDENVVYVESWQRRKDGEKRLLAWWCRVLKDENTGDVVGALSTGRDITERHLAVQRLENERSHLRTLVQTIPDLVWLKDPDGIYITCNPTFERFFGAKEADIVGKTDRDFVDAELADFFRQKDKEAMAAGRPSVNEEWITFADDGHRALLETIKTPMLDSEGRLIGVLGIARDITALRQAEEALRASEDKFSKTFRNSPDTIVVTNMTDGWLIDVNERFVQLSGYSREEVLGRTATELDLWSNSADRDRFVADLREKGRVTDFETAFRSKSGEIRSYLVSGECIEIAGEACILAILHDITDRKLAEDIAQVRICLLEFAAWNPVEELLQKVLDEIGALTNSPIGFYHFVESDQETLTLQAWSTRTLSEFCKAEGKGMHYRIEQAGVWTDCVHERRPVIHNDYGALPHRKGMPDGHAAVMRELVVPIMRSDSIVAMLGIGNKPTDYTEKDVEIVSYLADVAWEITEIKCAEAALRESEQRFRRLYEQSPAPYQSLDAEGNILDVNNAWLAELGYDRGEVVGKCFGDFLAGDGPALFLERFPQFKARGETHGVEFDMRRKDGASITVAFEGRIGRDDKGEFLQTHCVFTNITERRQAEAERTRLSSAIEQAAEVVVITDAEGIIQYVNPAFEKVTGYTRREALGQSPRILKSGEHSAEFYRQLWDTIKAGSTWSGRLINRRKDGSLFQEEATISPVRNASGRITDFVAVKRDITEHLQLSKQLFQAQKMEAVGTLAGGVAHDFNNLLQVVLGYSELISADGTLPPQCRDDLARINQAARNGADLVQRLLTFSRKTEVNPRPVNLNRRIEQLQKMLSRTLPKMIEMELILADNLAAINADPTQTEQVLMNLAINARDAMPEGGRLVIETRNVTLDEHYCKTHIEAKPGPYVLLSVTDTGQGMDRETVEHIFEPFFTTKGPGEGTGLGLAMVYGIVKQHGGHMICYSEVAKGTTFKIYFPALVSSEELREDETRTPPRGGSETILLVEDEELIRDLGSRILTKAGYKVIVASDGKEALEAYQASSHEIALVILDLIMPEMGGKQCLEGLLSLDPSVKVVIASGYSASGATREALASGARGFINKPYDIRQVLGVVRATLDEKTEQLD